MRAYNLPSPKTGNPVYNQFVIIDDNGIEWFQSYRSIIAKRTVKGEITLDNYYWDYSRTTTKYRNVFLGITTEETKKRIKEGRIVLDNLNK